MSPQTLENIICIYAVCVVVLTAGVLVNFMKNRHSVSNTGKHELAKLWSFAFLMVSAGYLCLVLKKHYGVDSFCLYWDPAPFHPIAEGRYFKAALYIFFLRTNINLIEFQQVFFALYLPATATSAIIIASSFMRIMKITDLSKKMVLTACVLLIFINTFSMELLLFPEVALENTIGNLIFACGLYIWLYDFNRPLRWILTFIFVFAMTTVYQLYMPMFVVAALTGTGIRHEKEIKEKYKEAVFILITGVMSWGIDFAFMTVLEKVGAVGPSDSVEELSLDLILSNAKNVIKVQKEIWTTCLGTYRVPFVMTAFGAGLLLVALMAFIRVKDNKRRLYWLLTFAGSYLLCFAVHFIEQPQEITPRSLLPIWSVIAALLIIGLYKETRPVYVIVLLMIMVNLFHMNDMSVNLLQTNEQDLYEAKVIADRIMEYEQKTGEKVTNTVFRTDGNMVYHHPDSRYKVYQLGARIMATYFSRYHCVGYFLGRDLTDEFMADEDFQRLGHGKDWDSFVPDEQIFIEDGKAYVFTY